VLAHAAWQVKQALEATHFLGGANYVLWGGREGYYSLLNTRMDKEKQHLAAFLKAVADHADAIGFTGKLLIEPKPCEPTLHQYDTDVDTVLAFLRRYDLDQRFFLNIEENHATLAGKTFMYAPPLPTPFFCNTYQARAEISRRKWRETR
jgi:xylose isomerase